MENKAYKITISIENMNIALTRYISRHALYVAKRK